MTTNKTPLWEWLDLGDSSRIYRFGKIETNGGFLIGGLRPSQAQKLVIAHNEVIRSITSSEEDIKNEPLIYQDIDIQAVREWTTGTISDFTECRLHELLTGECSLDEAREDVLSFMRRNRNQHTLPGV